MEQVQTLAQAVMSAVVVALLQNFVCNIEYSNPLKKVKYTLQKAKYDFPRRKKEFILYFL